MPPSQQRSRVHLKKILYLTDFSEPSEAALPFAISIARKPGAHLHALHVLLPCPSVSTTPVPTAIAIACEEEGAQADLERLNSQLAGVPHDTAIERALGVWDAVERAIEDLPADLFVLGTHGRTGREKRLLGSVAEQIFRRSPVPVLTIGPQVRQGMHTAVDFHRVIFATDFTPGSSAAAPYAVSLAEQNRGRLILLHVIKPPPQDKKATRAELSVAEALHKLYETVPGHTDFASAPEVAVEFGDPGERVVQIAKQRHADLVVLGARASIHPEAVTHPGRRTAHKVVARAPCPVLTVCG
ncbi:MAG: universal stress protein [Candidatus Acidiferrales bacterium]